MKSKTAVLIPCHNEEASIAEVVRKFNQVLPEAEIYVYDNASTDLTAMKAEEAGAIVRREDCKGKGNVVRRMFADIEADVYIMSDGDETYEICRAPDLAAELEQNQLDMVIGARQEVNLEAYRAGHRWGNFVLTKLVQCFFNRPLEDMLSGFRVFSRRFVKTFPAFSSGFEIETELTVYALSSRLPIKETNTKYFPRPAGSVSKLSTYKDGFRILKAIFYLIKEERPLLFFGLGALLLAVLSLAAGLPVIKEYLISGLVLRLPTAVLACGLMVSAAAVLLAGMVLDSLAQCRKELRRQNYLQYEVMNGKRSVCVPDKSERLKE